MISISAATTLFFLATATIVKYSVGISYLHHSKSFLTIAYLVPIIAAVSNSCLLLLVWFYDSKAHDDVHFPELASFASFFSTIMLFASMVKNGEPTLAYLVPPTVLVLQYAVYRGLQPEETRSAIIVFLMFICVVVSITTIIVKTVLN